MKFMITFIIIFNLFAEIIDEPIILKSSVNKALVTTGDILIFTVSLDHTKNFKEIDFIDIGSMIEGFRVIDFGIDKEEDGDRLITKRWYKLQADIVGSYILPSISLTLKDQVSGNSKDIKTSEVFVEVASVLNKDGNQKMNLKDIKSLEEVDDIPNYWMLSILGLLSLVGFIYYIYKRKDKKRAGFEEIIPAHIIAIESLEKLKTENFLENNEFKLFHFTLSEIIRNYFEGSFELSVTDMTTEEIKKASNKIRYIEDNLVKTFLNILEQTDIVKFTDTTLPLEVSENILKDTFMFIEETKPKNDLDESVI